MKQTTITFSEEGLLCNSPPDLESCPNNSTENEWTVIIHSSATVIQFSIQQFFYKLTNVHVEQAREAASFNNTRGFVFSNVTVRDMANPQLAPCWDD